VLVVLEARADQLPMVVHLPKVIREELAVTQVQVLVALVALEAQVQVLAVLQQQVQVAQVVSKLQSAEKEAKALTVTQTWLVQLALREMQQAEQLLVAQAVQVAVQRQ
jgi:hypothetical protein